jgi:hypothetical protein
MSLIIFSFSLQVRYEGQSAYTTEKGRKAKLHPSSVNNKSHLGGKKEGCKEKIEIIGFQGIHFIYLNFLNISLIIFPLFFIIILHRFNVYFWSWF